MIEINDKKNCMGCSACATACPKACITMIPDEEGFLYPQVNKLLCINCGLCEKICPVHLNKKNLNQSKAYAAINLDADIRLSSSSGGIFTELAMTIINKGGIVYGAAFNNEFNTEHIGIDNTNMLSKLRGAKYLQSKIGNSYSEVKSHLESRRYVLFSGTPCQVEGLLSYLGKEYDNLFTVDIICHGVPSSLVWQAYLKEIGNPSSVSFRNKENGWSRYSVKIITDDKIIIENHNQNPMMKAYLYNLCLRPSCYDCKFKKSPRISDITLADFWGIKRVLPKLDDDKGVSLVIVNTTKGCKLFDLIRHRIKVENVALTQAIKYNASYIHSPVKPNERNEFMLEITKRNFTAVVNEYCKENSVIAVLRLLKNKLYR